MQGWISRSTVKQKLQKQMVLMWHFGLLETASWQGIKGKRLFGNQKVTINGLCPCSTSLRLRSQNCMVLWGVRQGMYANVCKRLQHNSGHVASADEQQWGWLLIKSLIFTLGLIKDFTYERETILQVNWKFLCKIYCYILNSLNDEKPHILPFKCTWTKQCEFITRCNLSKRKKCFW